MSDETADADEALYSGESVSALLQDWYHVPVLGAVLAFMLYVRFLSYDAFLRDGRVLLSGNDAWYHLREVNYIVEHYPQVMPYDVWTYFPYGTSTGQFGTLYDHLVATGAMVVGLGDPSARTVSLTLLVAPAIFGALLAVPTYAAAKRLEGRLAGVFAAVVLAFLPGTVLSRSLVGSADHNAVEPLFQVTAVLATMVALHVAATERPVWEQLRDRDFAGLRRPLGWSVVAGVALALYMWVWPPGVLLVGILGVFYVLKLTTDTLRGTSPEHTAFVAAVSMSVAGLLMFVPFSQAGVSPTQFSLLQPGLAIATAVGAAVLAWLSRLWDRRDVARQLYPVSVVALAGVGLVVLAVALPDTFGMIRRNVVRFIGFNAGAQQRTIVEATPWLSRGEFVPLVFSQYGLGLFTALLGAVYLLDDVARAREIDGDRLLVLVWFAFLLSAAFTQVRFNYYLAVPVAVLNGVLFSRTISLEWFGGLRSAADVNPSQVLVGVAIVLLVVAPLATGVGGAASGLSVNSPQEVGANSQPGGYLGWQDSLDWMDENTPEVGNYGGAGNADQLDLYGEYAQTDDFDYPEGAYGVMSWWDYGHWLTVGANRIPTANPFQQGATSAANYLLAPNETDANDVLAGIDEDDAKTRYVAVDWQMVSTASKFAAPTIFYDRYDGVSAADYRTQLWAYGGPQTGYRTAAYVKSQAYYESMMVRLYRFHGSRQGTQPIVVDWAQNQTLAGQTQYIGPQNASQRIVTRFDNMSAAREYVRADGTSQVGGISDIPSRPVPALENYRMVSASPRSAPGAFRTSMGAYVKLFERVPGATVEGEARPNTAVRATVELEVPSRNRTFTYTQRAVTDSSGSFTMTLPYSTTDYDEYGTEAGYTDVAVRATGPYNFSGGVSVENGTLKQYAASADVGEGAVLGETNETIAVELTAQNLSMSDLQGSTAAPTGTSPSAAPSDETTSGESGDGATDRSGDGDGEQTSEETDDGDGAVGGTVTTTAPSALSLLATPLAETTATLERLVDVGTAVTAALPSG